MGKMPIYEICTIEWEKMSRTEWNLMDLTDGRNPYTTAVEAHTHMQK
jgi:hypothetical protein